MNNLLCIVGPTGVGKTRLALEIRSFFGLPQPQDNRNQIGGVDLVSIDSRQVYIGMDIGTGKDAKILGTDLLEPKNLFSVAEFVRMVSPMIQKIWKDGKLPILVGGTGFYLKALVDRIETIDVPKDEKLRKELENKSVKELQKVLMPMCPYVDNSRQSAVGSRQKREIDERRQAQQNSCGMNNSDWNNPRRLIRKIEILTNTNKYYHIQSASKATAGTVPTNANKKLEYNKLLIIGLTTSLPQIRKNIECRVQERLDKGLLEEIKGLVEKYGWNEVLRNTIAYCEWEDYFKGKITKNQALEKWINDEFNYAKRQFTWFKKDERVIWVEDNYLDDTLKLINKNHLLD